MNAEMEVLIYIGREDCKECIEFEEKFEKLLKDTILRCQHIILQKTEKVSEVRKCTIC